MSRRWTQADINDFRQNWLAQPHRCGHQWTGTSSRCNACGRKYGKAAGRLCPQRRKPGRWKLHCERALYRAQYPSSEQAECQPLTPARIIALLQECEQEVKHRSGVARGIRREYRSFDTLSDDQLWAYHPSARRYRRLLKRLWALPATEWTRAMYGNGYRSADPPDRWAAGFTRGRNKLVQQVRETGTPIVQVKGCTYRFYPDATYINTQGHRVALFPDEQVAP